MHSVAGPDWIAWVRGLAMEDGIFMGISGGYTFAMAMKLAEDAAEGSVMLVMLPDTGERYLSTPLFDGIAEQHTTPRSLFCQEYRHMAKRIVVARRRTLATVIRLA